jgi:ABC-type branched-subunit amino acid transport system ATPase component
MLAGALQCAFTRIVEQNLTFIERVADDVLVLDHSECVLAGSMAALGREALERHLLV